MSTAHYHRGIEGTEPDQGIYLADSATLQLLGKIKVIKLCKKFTLIFVRIILLSKLDPIRFQTSSATQINGIDSLWETIFTITHLLYMEAQHSLVLQK